MRSDSSPQRGLLRREQWPSYLSGMVAEVLYILALTGLALVAAVIAEAIM